MRRIGLSVAVCVVLTGVAAQAEVRITEFMSEGQGDTQSGNGGRRQREFFELTNLGNAAVDVSTWSYNDNNANDPLNFGSSFGAIGAHESVILTQMTPEDFRTYWGLSASVRVYSFAQLSNLGNADTINIYNSSVQDATTLVDSLTYTADARGSGVSRNRPWDGGQGQALNGAWIESSVGDAFGSFLAPSPTGFAPNFPQPTTGFNPGDYIDLANPGTYAVPEPAAMGVLAVGAFGLGRRRK